MTMLLTGSGVSKGVGIGPVHLFEHGRDEVAHYKIDAMQMRAEIARFNKAHKSAVAHLKNVRKLIPKDAGEEIAAFIDSHLLMMADVPFKQAPIQIIEEQLCNAEWALDIQKKKLVQVFDAMQDSYLKTRRNDVEHIIHLIQQALQKDKLVDSKQSHAEQAKQLKGYIIVSDDLAPADTIMFEHCKIGGFVTEYGGTNSHTAILARSLGIPAIVAVPNVRNLLSEDEMVIVDGDTGTLVANADKQMIASYRKKIKAEKTHQKQLAVLKNKPTRSRDGVDIKLMTNIELNEEVRAFKYSGAEGVGLYRTEFLYVDGYNKVNEEDHFAAYKKILRATDNKPVTIRTLDLGAEKEFDPDYEGPLAPNPALGLRAIRRSLKSPEIFLQQLRAILRASVYGEARILIPMLTSLNELEQIMELYKTARKQLKEQKKRFKSNIKIGGMIEVPATALAADAFARRLDFLSIGTNDLIQYALAIDRIDEEVNYLYNPLHPGVLNMISIVLEAGRRLNVPVAMCGEMAGDSRYTTLLLAMGLREFSVHPNNLLEIKQIIMDSDIGKLQRKYQRMKTHSDMDRIAEFCS
ncbi:MAG: phosphoenolpyruvate--protein phosphotransferase [Gammaproteobacteria bacterium]|nr:phosphoenolpyruvate--protein phosphotransferase [Gammaproteobacteria bacterium]